MDDLSVKNEREFKQNLNSLFTKSVYTYLHQNFGNNIIDA
jgi:hypothetical protein